MRENTVDSQPRPKPQRAPPRKYRRKEEEEEEGRGGGGRRRKRRNQRRVPLHGWPNDTLAVTAYAETSRPS